MTTGSGGTGSVGDVLNLSGNYIFQVELTDLEEVDDVALQNQKH